jgi:hypothetical protein
MEYLASLIHCCRPDGDIRQLEQQGELPLGVARHVSRTAKRLLRDWIDKELDSERHTSVFNRLSKAERWLAGDARRYPRLKAVALLTYMWLVWDGNQNPITKGDLWTNIEDRYRCHEGLALPDRRRFRRILGEIGLSGLPENPVGRPKKIEDHR